MSYKKLKVYQMAFDLATEIFVLTKNFPGEEKYSLTDQIRRSSRSVCVTIAEAYGKRNYPAYFVSKTSDSDMENSETQVWMDFAHECKYLNAESRNELNSKLNEIGKMLNHMINNPEKYA